MKLNLSIVTDSLSGLTPIQENTDPMAPRCLCYPRLYRPGDTFSPGTLYIAHSEELPAQPDIPKDSALLCLGFPPPAYSGYPIEMVCCSSSLDKQELFYSVQQIFFQYGEYDEMLKDMVIDDKGADEFGRLALKIFETPATAFGAFEKILFLADGRNPSEISEPDEVPETDYWPEDERSILFQDEAFRKSLEVHGPTYFETGIYKTQIIFCNLFERDYYIGRFMIENTFRPFRKGDYRLVEWFGEYIRRLLRKNRQYRFSAGRDFEQMIRDLSAPGGQYRPEYDQILPAFGWEKTDHYLCHTIVAAGEPQADQVLIESAYYLEDLLDSQYLYLQNHALVQIIDLTRTGLQTTEVQRRLNLFLNSNALLAGSSTEFSDFTQLSVYLHQSRLMAAYAQQDQQQKLYEFDSHVLPMLLKAMQNGCAPEELCTQSLKKLMDYDRETGAELVPTLRCYLENDRNINQTYEKLYIARTTCLYRIRRIRELTHLRLEDPDTNLYLRLVLRIAK